MSSRDHTSKSVVGFKIFANHEAIMFIEILQHLAASKAILNQFPSLQTG